MSARDDGAAISHKSVCELNVEVLDRNVESPGLLITNVGGSSSSSSAARTGAPHEVALPEDAAVGTVLVRASSLAEITFRLLPSGGSPGGDEYFTIHRFVRGDFLFPVLK